MANSGFSLFSRPCPAPPPAPVEVASLPAVVLARHVTSSQIVCNQLWYIWSDGTKTVEDLPCTIPEPVINITNNFEPTTNVAAPEVTNNFAPTTNVAAPEVTNNFAPTTNVAAPEVTLPAPNLVALAVSDTGVVTATLSNGDTVPSNPLPSC